MRRWSGLSGVSTLKPKDRYNALLSARKEIKATKSNKWRHIFQCIECGKCVFQQNYETSLVCKCGGEMPIVISYDANNNEYNARTGETYEEPKQTESCVKVIRSELGLTQKDLAKIIGVSQQFIAQVESRKRPMNDKLEEWVYEHL
jgi:ribosome-binding protein aMBF1 (putative translation factor)